MDGTSGVVKYRGYCIRQEETRASPQFSARRVFTITLNERFMAFTDSASMARHAIDVKIAEGVWPGKPSKRRVADHGCADTSEAAAGHAQGVSAGV